MQIYNLSDESPLQKLTFDDNKSMRILCKIEKLIKHE